MRINCVISMSNLYVIRRNNCVIFLFEIILQQRFDNSTPEYQNAVSMAVNGPNIILFMFV